MTFKIGNYYLFKYYRMLSLLRVICEDENTYYVDIIYANYGIDYKLKTKGYPLDKANDFENFTLADQETINHYYKLAIFQ